MTFSCLVRMSLVMLLLPACSHSQTLRDVLSKPSNLGASLFSYKLSALKLRAQARQNCPTGIPATCQPNFNEVPNLGCIHFSVQEMYFDEAVAYCTSKCAALYEAPDLNSLEQMLTAVKTDTNLKGAYINLLRKNDSTSEWYFPSNNLVVPVEDKYFGTIDTSDGAVCARTTDFGRLRQQRCGDAIHVLCRYDSGSCMGEDVNFGSGSCLSVTTNMVPFSGAAAACQSHRSGSKVFTVGSATELATLRSVATNQYFKRAITFRGAFVDLHHINLGSRWEWKPVTDGGVPYIQPNTAPDWYHFAFHGGLDGQGEVSKDGKIRPRPGYEWIYQAFCIHPIAPGM